MTSLNLDAYGVQAITHDELMEIEGGGFWKDFSKWVGTGVGEYLKMMGNNPDMATAAMNSLN
ncbi:MAG: hypothetical protein LBI82_02385 [Dysgonamonadaceae bacterium]|jgi:hypothetical protein|nr:hypothetical protein [Dysgonamonadaceae bacterium]